MARDVGAYTLADRNAVKHSVLRGTAGPAGRPDLGRPISGSSFRARARPVSTRPESNAPRGPHRMRAEASRRATPAIDGPGKGARYYDARTNGAVLRAYEPSIKH